MGKMKYEIRFELIVNKNIPISMNIVQEWLNNTINQDNLNLLIKAKKKINTFYIEVK